MYDNIVISRGLARQFALDCYDVIIASIMQSEDKEKQEDSKTERKKSNEKEL